MGGETVKSYADRLREYEQAKADLARQDLTAEQYETALREIARMLKI